MLFKIVVLTIIVAFITSLTILLGFLKILKKKLDTHRILDSLKTEISELIIELNSATERNIVLLENKTELLNEAIGKATRIQSILTREYEKYEYIERIYSRHSQSEKESFKIKIEPETIPVVTDVSDTLQLDKLSEKDNILALYRRGESTATIAEDLGMSRGKVELILSLHDR